MTGSNLPKSINLEDARRCVQDSDRWRGTGQPEMRSMRSAMRALIQEVEELRVIVLASSTKREEADRG